MKNVKTNMSKVTILAGAFALAGFAANSQATLSSTSGDFAVEGEILEVNDSNYVIKTELGELIVNKDLVRCEGVGCPSEESATETDRVIKLTSADGSISFEGTLLELTETDYMIATSTGDLTIRRELVGCEGAACPATAEVTVQDRLTIFGPSDVGVSIISAVARHYSAAKGLNVTVSDAGDNSSDLFIGNASGVEVARISAKGTSALTAVRAVAEGNASFALVRERVTPEMLAAFTGRQANGLDNQVVERTIGLDALSFVAHPSNPIDSISIDAIRGIMTGQIREWNALGGPDGTINIHSLSMDSELMVLANQRLFGPRTQGESAGHIYHETTEELNAALLSDPAGFGVIFRSLQGELTPLELASSCNIHYGSSDFSVQTQEYPFAIGWYLYAAKDASQSDFGRNLVSFLQTDEGQESLSSLGLLSQGLRSQAMKDQGSRVLTGVLTNQFGHAGNQVVAEYLGEVAESKRLSTSLRFTSGSSAPDGKAREDIDRISALIRQPRFANYVVKLVGFSDSVGKFGKNILLSQSRAQEIKSLLLKDNPGWLTDESVQIMGAGPIAPVHCNDTDEGRRLNRRVEVWLAPPQSSLGRSF